MNQLINEDGVGLKPNEVGKSRSNFIETFCSFVDAHCGQGNKFRNRTEMSDAVGLDRRCIYNYMGGKSLEPPIYMLIAVSEACGHGKSHLLCIYLEEAYGITFEDKSDTTLTIPPGQSVTIVSKEA